MLASQAMVRVTHGAGGEQAFFVARGVADGAAGAWSAVITSQALAKQTGPVGGRAALAFVIGDVDVDNPIEWEFAQVRLALTQQCLQVIHRRSQSSRVAYTLQPDSHHDPTAPQRLGKSLHCICYAIPCGEWQLQKVCYVTSAAACGTCW